LVLDYFYLSISQTEVTIKFRTVLISINFLERRITKEYIDVSNDCYANSQVLV
jgi:hypothetical protein